MIQATEDCLTNLPQKKLKHKKWLIKLISLLPQFSFTYISSLSVSPLFHSSNHHSSHPCPAPHTSQCENHTQASHAFQSYRVDFQNSLGANSITRSPYRSNRERVRQSTQANNVLFYKITPHHRALWEHWAAIIETCVTAQPIDVSLFFR